MYWALCTLKPKKPLKKFQKNLGFFPALAGDGAGAAYAQ